MDCKTARVLLLFSRPLTDELDADEAEALATHLAECADCRQLRRAETAVDSHIGRAVRDVPAPAGLRDRVIVRLAEQRRTTRRSRLFKASCALAAAAVVLALGWFLWPRNFQQIDLERLSQHVNFVPRTPEQVEDAFHEQGLEVVVPGELNYAFLTDLGQVQLQGRLTPYLEFRAGSASLRVYILDGNRVNLAALEQNPEGPSGRVTVRWWGRSSNGKFGYIIEHTGPSLEPFKARDLVPAA